MTDVVYYPKSNRTKLDVDVQVLLADVYDDAFQLVVEQHSMHYYPSVYPTDVPRFFDDFNE